MRSGSPQQTARPGPRSARAADQRGPARATPTPATRGCVRRGDGRGRRPVRPRPAELRGCRVCLRPVPGACNRAPSLAEMRARRTEAGAHSSASASLRLACALPCKGLPAPSASDPGRAPERRRRLVRGCRRLRLRYRRQRIHDQELRGRVNSTDIACVEGTDRELSRPLPCPRTVTPADGNSRTLSPEGPPGNIGDRHLVYRLFSLIDCPSHSHCETPSGKCRCRLQ